MAPKVLFLGVASRNQLTQNALSRSTRKVQNFMKLISVATVSKFIYFGVEKAIFNKIKYWPFGKNSC